MKNYYDILGVSKRASDNEIKKAFKKKGKGTYRSFPSLATKQSLFYFCFRYIFIGIEP